MDKNKGGRPKLKIDYSLVEKLASIQCTQEEISDILEISVRTLLRDKKFCHIYKKGLGTGKMSLRRKQWTAIENGSVPMMIFMGKQILGQSDTPQEVEIKKKELELKQQEFEFKKQIATGEDLPFEIIFKRKEIDNDGTEKNETN